MIPKTDLKWSSIANDPEKKIRMAWNQVTASSCHVYYRNKKQSIN